MSKEPEAQGQAVSDSVQFGHSMRPRFPLDPSINFINHGSYGCAPNVATEAAAKTLAAVNANPEEWFRFSGPVAGKQALIQTCQLLHLPPTNVVFVDNATTGINTVLKTLGLSPKDAILYSDLLYGAVIYTIQDVAATIGCTLVQVSIKLPVTPDAPQLKVSDILEAFEAQLKLHSNIRIAVIDHITSATALRMPVLELIDLFKRYNVLTLVDGAHAPAQVSEEELGQVVGKADFFTGNLHKWAYVPRALAILTVQPAFQNVIKPLVTSWNYPTRARDHQFQPIFFTLGTRDFSNVYSVPAAIAFIKSIGGLEAVRKYNTKLADDATALLEKKLGTFTLNLEPGLASPFMRLVRLPDALQDKEGTEVMYDFLHEKKFFVNVVRVNGVLFFRISAQIYNELEDYERAANAILEYAAEAALKATSIKEKRFEPVTLDT